MKVIIAGSRNVQVTPTDIARMISAAGFNVTAVVSGTARGVDQCGEKFAEVCNVPVVRFPADWNTYGKSAGYRRNVEMAEFADALLAIWDGESKGTKHMIDIAKNKGLQVFVVKYERSGYARSE